jgi:hypothetical protein
MLLFFLILSILISIIGIRSQSQGKNDLFKFIHVIGIGLAVILPFSFYLNYFNIEIKPLYTIIFLVTLSLIFLYLKTRKQIVKTSILKTIKSDYFVTFFIVFIFSTSIGIYYFHKNIELPQYVTIDPSVHYLMSDYITNTGYLSFIKKDSLMDTANNYPFGASVIISFSSQLIPTESTLQKFQILNILMFSLINSYLVILFKKHYKNKDIINDILLYFLIIPGFIFSMMIMGFVSQLYGLFFLLLFFDIYDEHKSTYLDFFILSLIFSAILITYLYWAPVAIIFIALKNITILDLSNIKKNIPTLKNILLLIVSTSVIALPYLLSLWSSNVAGTASSDGLTYKTFLINFIIILPFIVFGIYRIIKNRLFKSSIPLLLLSSISYFVILYILFLFNKVSAYTAAKVIYIIGPVLFFIGVAGFDSFIHTYSIKNKFINKLINITIVFVVIFFISSPFIIKNDGYSIDTTPSFNQINFFTTNGDPFDIFILNGQLTTNPSAHNYNVTKSQLEFMHEIQKFIPERYKDNKITTIADPVSGLWLYSISSIWPRVKLSEKTNIFSLDEYSDWILYGKSPILILLDSKETQKWIMENNFNMNDYHILYKNNDNYLLELKNDNVSINLKDELGTSDVNQKNISTITEMPIEINIVTKYNGLSSISMLLSNYNQPLSDDYMMEIHNINCNGNIERTAVIQKNSIKNDRYNTISFDAIKKSKNQKYCISIKEIPSNNVNINDKHISLVAWLNKKQNKIIATLEYKITKNEY